MTYSNKVKWVGMIVSLLIIFLIYEYFFNINPNNSGNIFAQNAVKQINNIGIEYVKNQYDNKIIEHWRDLRNLQDRADTFNSNGIFIRKMIVKENGKRVISIVNNNGQIEGYTWVLPENYKKANEDIIKQSILKDLKSELLKNTWKVDGTQKLPDGKLITRISSSKNNNTQIVYIDTATGFPLKREIYKREIGKLKLIKDGTEEYKKIDSNTTSLFSYGNYKLKEIPAPV